MGGPGWLAGVFAALMLTVAAYCTGRLVAARRWRRPTELDTDGAHIIMGVAMAGMLVSGLRVLPAGSWAGVFAAGAAWFGARLLRPRRGAAVNPWRCLHAGPHLIECAAMLYMLLVVPASAGARGPGTGMGGMTGSAAPSRFSFLALAMALFLLGYAAWLGDRLGALAPAGRLRLPGPLPAEICSGAVHGRPLLAPRCAVLCKIAMGVTMGYMLILMI